MERPKFAGIVALFMCGGFFPAAEAAYEIWTRKDGKAAEMELLGLERKDGEEIVSFRTRGGGTVTMNLIDLQQADWKRARDAATPAPGPATPEVSFGKASVSLPKPAEEKGGKAYLNFLFAVKGEKNYAGIKEDSLVAKPFRIGGKTLTAKQWRVGSGTGPNAGLTLQAKGDFEPGDLSGCTFSGSVVGLMGNEKLNARVEAQVPAKTGITSWMSVP